MRSFRQLRTLLFFVFCLGSVPMAATHAAGGGGGIMPSTAPQIDPVKKYKQGVKYLQAEKYKKASKSFRAVLSVAKKDANSHYLLGLSYIGLEKYSKARKSLLKALKYKPDMIAAKGRLAYVYNQLGKADQSEELKQSLLALQQQCGECADKDAIAEALAIAGRATSASLDVHLAPFANTSAGDLAYIEAVGFINRGEYQRALNMLSEAGKAFGPHPDILTYQGFAHRKMGQAEQAYGFYQAALTVDPEHRGANEYLGEYFVERKDLLAAKAQLAILRDICDFGCEEAQELNRWIIAAES